MSDGSAPTLFLRLIARALGGTHPLRLTVAVCLGAGLHGVFQSLASALPDDAPLRAALLSLALWQICAMMVATLFLPLVFGKRGAPDDVRHAIAVVEAILDRAGLSKIQRKTTWLAILDRYVKGLNFQSPPRQNLADLAAAAVREETDGEPVSQDDGAMGRPVERREE